MGGHASIGSVIFAIIVGIATTIIAAWKGHRRYALFMGIWLCAGVFFGIIGIRALAWIPGGIFLLIALFGLRRVDESKLPRKQNETARERFSDVISDTDILYNIYPNVIPEEVRTTILDLRKKLHQAESAQSELRAAHEELEKSKRHTLGSSSSGSVRAAEQKVKEKDQLYTSIESDVYRFLNKPGVVDFLKSEREGLEQRLDKGRKSATHYISKLCE